MGRSPEEEKAMTKALEVATPGPRASRRRVAKKAVKNHLKYGGVGVKGTMQPVNPNQPPRWQRRAHRG